jgi:hypothetical protein
MVDRNALFPAGQLPDTSIRHSCFCFQSAGFYTTSPSDFVQVKTGMHL